MDDAPDAAVVAESNAAARAHLVVRDDKGRIVVPPLEDRSAVLAEVTRRLSVDEITAGCQQIHQLIADQSKHIERRMQIAKSKRKILSDAAELVRERQAELTKLKQVQATLSQPPPPLPPIATAESLAAKLDEQKQKLSKLNAKLEGRKAELTQRTEEAKQAATQLLKVREREEHPRLHTASDQHDVMRCSHRQISCTSHCSDAAGAARQVSQSRTDVGDAQRTVGSAGQRSVKLDRTRARPIHSNVIACAVSLLSQEKCKKLSEANESIHSHTMHDHEFLEGCKHKVHSNRDEQGGTRRQRGTRTS